MSILFVKRERSERVPLGAQLRMDGHWSTQGLALVHTCSDLREQSRPNGEIFVPTSTPTLRPSGILFDANAEYVSAGIGTSPLTTDKPITVLAIASCNVSNTTRKRLFRLSEPAYGTVVNIDFADGTSNLMGFGVRVGTSLFASASSFTPAANKRYVVVGRHRPGDYPQLFVDGILRNTSGTAGTMHLAPTLCTIGGNTGSLTFNGTAELVLVWNRYLTDAEIGAITANPYQSFQPLLVPVFVGAGGTPISLTHDLRAAIATAQTGFADSRIAVSGSLLLVADCLTAVATTAAAAQDTRTAIANQTAQVHDTRLTVAVALTTLCDTLLNVSAQVGYAVNHDTRLTIATARSLAQDLRATVASQATTTHDTRQAVATAVTALADTLADIAAQIGYTMQQDTRLVVSRQFSSAADTLAALATEIRTTQDTRLIIGLIQRAAGVIYRLAAERRVHVLPPERRVFVLSREGKA